MVSPIPFFFKIMLQLEKIKEKFLPLVAWRQPYDIDEQLQDEALLQGVSGLFYNDAHPLLTYQNIKAIMPLDFINRYPAWKSDVLYHTGDRVRKGDDIYCALQDSQDKDPVHNAAYWQRWNMMNDFLRDITEAQIATFIQEFLTMKSLLKESKPLLEQRTFFDGAGRLNASLPNGGYLVGFEITPVRSAGVTSKIDRIGLQMVGGTGDVHIYLFHSSQPYPIYDEVFSYTNNGGFQWFRPTQEWLMPYTSDRTDAGGSWYLLYNQNQLPQGMEGVNVSKDWSREPCGTCNVGTIQAWRELTKYLQLSPFKYPAPSSFDEQPTMFDVQDIIYTNTSNYGMNVEVSVGCDLTEWIVGQRNMFATALQKQVAVNVLRMMAMNPDVRVNRYQSNVSKQDIIDEIDGSITRKGYGIGQDLERAMKAIDLDTRGLDRVCLTCQPLGVKYRTV